MLQQRSSFCCNFRYSFQLMTKAIYYQVFNEKFCYTRAVCDEVATCDTCLSLPSCGWCDDGSGKGLGRCMDGSSRGPLVVNSTSVTVNWTLCLSKEWHFTDCPGKF